jgi:pimeloyl-ACP methyl ester carboxylesterase
MSERTVRLSDLDFRVFDEGSGDPVLLLHGFPDSAELWRHQRPALVRAGYRVVAPDLRGFGASARPHEVDAYRIETILGDVVGVLDALAIADAHVICHDWGAALGWSLAAFLPDRVRSLAALSVGHPRSFGAAGLEQREKSWYMLLFQFEDTAEELLRRDDWRLMRDWTRHHPELSRWIPALERPGALRAALNWYRANAHPAASIADDGGQPFPSVRARTLGLWSSGDAYLTESQMVGSAPWVEGGWRYERVEGASHWLQLDRPDHVNRLLLDFLRG